MADPNAAELTWQRLIAAHRDPNPEPEPEHRPAAAILACSDARVPPSVIFDQPVGSLFMVRHAGNTARPGSVASLDYAVHHLDVDLVIVMGHTGCGAVTAALNGPEMDPVLEPILGPIRPALAGLDPTDPDAVGKAVSANVANTMSDLARHPGPCGIGVRAGTVQLRGAVHDLATGELHTIQNSLNNATKREIQ
jgi:carbonic anhydrase